LNCSSGLSRATMTVAGAASTLNRQRRPHTTALTVVQGLTTTTNQELVIMAVIQISRIEIAALAERLMARAESRLMNGTPELQRDLRVAAIVLQAALSIGFPVRPIEIANDHG